MEPFTIFSIVTTIINELTGNGMFGNLAKQIILGKHRTKNAELNNLATQTMNLASQIAADIDRDSSIRTPSTSKAYSTQRIKDLINRKFSSEVYNISRKVQGLTDQHSRHLQGAESSSVYALPQNQLDSTYNQAKDEGNKIKDMTNKVSKINATLDRDAYLRNNTGKGIQQHAQKLQETKQIK